MVHSVNIVSDNIISALGFSTGDNLSALHDYRCGIAPVSQGGIADNTHFLAATIDSKQLKEISQILKIENYTRLEQLMICSISDAIKGTDISLLSEDTILILSSTKGNVDLLHHAEIIPDKAFLWQMGERIGNYFGVKHTPIIISNACISGLSALIQAQRLLQKGDYSHAIVCGGDVLSQFICSGFASFRSLSKQPCRPYDALRDGLTLGEACATMVLSVIYPGAICISGGAISNDANHISAPSRTGAELSDAILCAMHQADIKANEVALLNMHGTATIYNDEMESKAAYLSGLANVPANGLKGYIGHTLGASGVIESIICAHELENSLLYGTIGFETCDLPHLLNISNKHRLIQGDHALKTASGFGGCNAALVLSKNYTPNKNNYTLKSHSVRTCRIEQGQIWIDDIVRFTGSSTDFSTFIREAYKSLERPYARFQKMDPFSRIGYVAAEFLLDGIEKAPASQIAILAENAAASLDTDWQHQQNINTLGSNGASPALFVYTLPNVMLGEICIRHQIKGENTFYIAKQPNIEALKEQAEWLMANADMQQVIICWCELLHDHYQLTMELLEKDNTINKK